jgi:predicted nucleic acid-binding protein
LSNFFVDTSSLAKRYVNEVGSTWVRSWTMSAAGNVIVISDLTTVEMASLLARRVREGTLAATDESILSSAFLLNVEQEYLSVALDTTVLISARQLVRKHALWALDSLQLACALQAGSQLKESMTFVCGDAKLLAAAAAEGFLTDDPNRHP